MRPLRNGNGDRSCRESWRTSGRRSSRDLKVRMPFPSTAALPHWLPVLPSPELPITSSQPLRDHPTCPPKQMMLPMRPRNPSPSQPGQIAWPGNMPRSTSSSGVRQREPADPHGLRAPGTAGGSRRRSSGSSESEPGPKRRNCVRAEPGGRRRRSGIALRSRPELGPGQSTPEAQGGADSGALVMCLGPALGEGTQKPWLQHWWPGVPPWRNRGL